MKDSSLLKSLYNLDNAFGVSGEETEVAGVLFKEMEGLYDEHFEDPMGNQYFIRYGKNKRPGKGKASCVFCVQPALRQLSFWLF